MLNAWRGSPLVRLGPYAPGAARVAAPAPGDAPSLDAAGTSWAVVELDAGLRRARVLAHHPVGREPAHNALAVNGRVVVNDSDRGHVLALDRHTGEIVRRVELEGEKPFPRGVTALADGRLLVGTQSPLALRIVDLDAERVDDRILLPDDHGEAPYAVASVPATFADPAGRLPATRAQWPIVAADARRTGRGSALDQTCGTGLPRSARTIP
jgi:hypothetical protein